MSETDVKARTTSVGHGADGTCSVTVAGTSGTLNINVEAGFTVADVLSDALQQLGAANNVAKQLSAVLNGEDADMDTPVKPRDRVTAAPRVENG